MDLPQIIPDEVTEQLAYVLDFEPEDVLRTSAKTREGILEVLDAIVERVPHPNGADGDADEARALMFDSWYDPVRGFCGLIAVHDGCVREGQTLTAMHQGINVSVQQIGMLLPEKTLYKVASPRDKWASFTPASRRPRSTWETRSSTPPAVSRMWSPSHPFRLPKR